MSKTEWETICNRCGGCCFEKKIDKLGTVHTTTVPCRFLDIHERTCRIYSNRLHVEEDCILLTPENISTLSWLPEDCAYRRL
ncbi:MAG: hypothetical protein OQK97_13230 [Deltaproteobacteria bacterium]|nr:hypothetical protein [Deltaproteobacteria bacterium]MCW8893174.1 hypothetical protein [Deltaproteobacteria bacterium]